MEEFFPHERTEEILLYSIINEPISAIETLFESGPLGTTDHLLLLERMEFVKGDDENDSLDGARLLLIGIISGREDVIRLGFSYGPKLNLFKIFVLLRLLNEDIREEFSIKIISGVRILVKVLLPSFKVFFGESIKDIFQFDSYVSAII